jgi:hypothetical protein
MSDRIIEPQKLKLKLLNGKTIEVRSLTLSERKECLEKVPDSLFSHMSDATEEEFAEKYMDVQIDVVHYIISRSCKNFTKEDVEKKLDASMIEELLITTLKDPFLKLLQWEQN